MADKFWQSNSSTDWATGANWSGGTVPVLNDDVYFTGEGTADCTGPTGLADLGTGKITVAESYASKLGTSGQPIDVSAAGIEYRGAGAEAWFEGDYNDVYVRTKQNGTNAVNFRNSGADDIDNLHVAMGRVNLEANSTITDMFVRWAKEPRRDAMLFIASGCTINGELHAEGCYVECASALGEVIANDATIKLTADAGNVSELLQNNGRFDYLGNGSMNVIRLAGRALFDIGLNGRAMTIGELQVGPGAEARTNRGGNVVTYNNDVIVFGNGRFESFQDAATVIRI